VTGWLPEGWIEVGRVERTLGLDGSLVVGLHGDDPANLIAAAEISLRGAPGSIPFRVLGARARAARGHPRVELRLAGIASREQAREWLGASVSVARGALPPPAEDEYYAHDLIGLEVRAPDGESLGRVSEIWPNAGHDLLVVETSTGPVLVPAIAPVLVRVDLAARELWIDPPAGLFPPREPGS